MSTGEQGGRDPKPIAPAKFWLKSALVILIVGILLAWAWMPSRHEEPVYQGKPMSEWLRSYAFSNHRSEVEIESEAALRKIGTNGIPTLLKMIQTRDSAIRTILRALMLKQTFLSDLRHAENIRSTASFGFRALGEDAKGAVPELLTVVKGGSGTVGREEAMYALGHIGPSAQSATPTLIAIASDVNDPDRDNAIRSLGFIRSSPESVVPCLESCLRDPDDKFRWIAALALSEFGEAARSSVPTLLPLLADPSEIVRKVATNALTRIDRAAATKAGIP